MDVLSFPDTAREENGVARRWRIRVERLNRIDDHSGDIPFHPANGVERSEIDVLQRDAVVDLSLAAQPRLYAVPPSMIGARETDDRFPMCVKSRESDRGHDGFGPAHMERYLVQPGYGLEHGNVFSDDRMKRPQDGTQVLHALPSLLHPFLVLIVAGDVDSVRAGHIEGPLIVDIP